ncbi:tetratricopeptide repeat protein [Flavobacterium sp.]|uniref:tetratricopeptide repeat protein n=1 Tax=Flavobacterium sp. TaxID=239 RepID=UPI0037531BB1
MKLLKIIFLLINGVAFGQQTQGYWDKERITNKEIKVSAGEKIMIKSEDFPEGTTEFVYRITVLDENQKLVSDLASVLKAIPDPYFIGKGTGGAINLASAISGSDKCTYAVFSDNAKANNFTKTGNTKSSCILQSNPVSKDAKVVSLEKSSCLKGESQNVWFGFQSENWLLGEKIVLEIVPWIDIKSSKIWSQSNKKPTISFIKTTETASILPSSDGYCYNILEKLQNQYKFSAFQKLSVFEKNQAIAKFEILALQETNNVINYNKYYRQKSNSKALDGKFEDAIQLLNNKVINFGMATALDYNVLSEMYIYTKQFEKAFKYLKLAEKLDATELLVQLNLAHTYMFLDKVSESKKIHTQFLNQNVSATQSWKNKTINDLNKFQKMNLPADNFKKVLRLMD